MWYFSLIGLKIMWIVISWIFYGVYNSAKGRGNFVIKCFFPWFLTYETSIANLVSCEDSRLVPLEVPLWPPDFGIWDPRMSDRKTQSMGWSLRWQKFQEPQQLGIDEVTSESNKSSFLWCRLGGWWDATMALKTYLVKILMKYLYKIQKYLC